MEFILYLLIGLIVTYNTINTLNKYNITGDFLISCMNDPELEYMFLNHPSWLKYTLYFIFTLEVFFWPLAILYMIYSYMTSGNNNNNNKFNGFSI